jgi:hypothetical protein
MNFEKIPTETAEISQGTERKNEQDKERDRGFKLDFYVTDHSPDNADTGDPEKLRELYADIKRDGVTSVRYDWHWRNVEPKPGELSGEHLDRYQVAKEIMAEVGLEPPTIILSNPPKWAVELYKTDKEKFYIEYRKYTEAVKERLAAAGGEKVSRVQILNELNNTIYTPVATEDMLRLAEITRAVFRDYNPELKLMITVIAANLTGFAGQGGTPIEQYLPELEKIKDSFDDIAVDYYPGMWHLQTGDDPKLRPLEIIRRMKEDPEELFKEMAKQIGPLKAIFEKIASWGKEYELGEVGSPTQEPWEKEEEHGKPQRYFYDVFFKEFKKMLVDFRSRNVPLPSRVGFYEAMDEPPRTMMGKFLKEMTPFPEHSLGMREGSGERKPILRGSPHTGKGPSQLSKIISYLRSPVEK